MPLAAPGTVESTRLVVRLAVEDDLPSLLQVNGNDEVTQFLPYATWQSLADAQAWYQRMAGAQEAGTAWQFVLALKATGAVIGSCLLFRFDEGSARAELGYVLGRAHWGQGHMREALVALIDHAFGPMNLRRLEAEVNPLNAASVQLLQRLGFEREGLRRERWVAKGQARDVVAFGLLQREWRGGGV